MCKDMFPNVPTSGGTQEQVLSGGEQIRHRGTRTQEDRTQGEERSHAVNELPTSGRDRSFSIGDQSLLEEEQSSVWRMLLNQELGVGTEGAHAREQRIPRWLTRQSFVCHK